jgi:crossover junction endodeoxyribonuclease RuvC
MSIMGIDPGLTGAVAVIDKKGKVITYASFPTIGNRLDLKGLLDLMSELKKDHKPNRAFLEKAHALPNQGVTSMFNFGVTAGHLEMCLASLKIPYEQIVPRVWTAVMHKGLSRNMTAKERSLQLARGLFPEEDFTLTERATKPHNGVVDALLIAEYGRMKLAGEG